MALCREGEKRVGTSSIAHTSQDYGCVLVCTRVHAIFSFHVKFDFCRWWFSPGNKAGNRIILYLISASTVTSRQFYVTL